jgi:hypothetical protein
MRAAAQLLERSERQVWRLLKAFRRDGAAGLVSKKRGRPSNRKTAAPVRAAVLWIVRQYYADFGPTLAAEKLAAEHGFGLIASSGKSGSINRALGATASANLCRSMAASTGGSRIAGRNAPCWSSSTTRPAG